MFQEPKSPVETPKSSSESEVVIQLLMFECYYLLMIKQVPAQDQHTFARKQTKKLTWCFYCAEFIWYDFFSSSSFSSPSHIFLRGFFSKPVYCCSGILILINIIFMLNFNVACKFTIHIKCHDKALANTKCGTSFPFFFQCG